MEAKYLRYCTVASFLASVAFVAGMVAEKNRQPGQSPSCDYSKIALGLGIVAVLFTIIARIYMSVSFGRSAGGCRKLLWVQSWGSTVAAVFFFISAAILGQTHGVGEGEKCPTVRKGLFASGASFALASAAFGIAAFKKSIPPQDPEIAIPVASNVDPEKNTGDQASKI